MSHPAPGGEVSAILRSVDAVEPLKVGETIARFVATGSITNGHFGLFRWDMSTQVGGARSAASTDSATNPANPPRC